MINFNLRFMKEYIYLISFVGFVFFIFNLSISDVDAQFEFKKGDEKTVEKLDIPSIEVSYNNNEVEMEPYIYLQDNVQTQIVQPILEDDDIDIKELDLVVKRGDSITIEYDEKPSKITAFGIDYNTDEVKLHQLTKIEDSTFVISDDVPDGLITLEIRSVYNDKEISYTTPIFIEP